MVKKYPLKESSDLKNTISPSIQNINAILNYSKSLEVKIVNRRKLLIHLN